MRGEAPPGAPHRAYFSLSGLFTSAAVHSKWLPSHWQHLGRPSTSTFPLIPPSHPHQHRTDIPSTATNTFRHSQKTDLVNLKNKQNGKGQIGSPSPRLTSPPPVWGKKSGVSTSSANDRFYALSVSRPGQNGDS